MNFPFSLHSSRWLAGALAILLTLSGCKTPDSGLTADSKTDSSEPTSESTYSPKELSPQAQRLNDVARLLAGMDSVEGQDTHPKWRSENLWQTHKSTVDGLWQEFMTQRGEAIRNWSYSEIADLQKEALVVQPFGGPNFLSAFLMFPNAEKLVLCGQASCIDLPEMDKLSMAAMQDTTRALEESLAKALDSAKQQEPTGPSREAVEGALPLLLALAARTGHTVETLEVMPFDPSTATAGNAPNNQPASACVLTLRTVDGLPRKIYYFQQELTDDKLPDDSMVLAFLEQQGKGVVLLRSTGHELHRNETSRIQERLLASASAIVQDPSGLPFRILDKEGWTVACYGSYIGAPNDFRDYDQPDLVKVYRNSTASIKTLPFGRGSLAENLPAALLVARPTPPPVPALTTAPTAETTQTPALADVQQPVIDSTPPAPGEDLKPLAPWELTMPALTDRTKSTSSPAQ